MLVGLGMFQVDDGSNNKLGKLEITGLRAREVLVRYRIFLTLRDLSFCNKATQTRGLKAGRPMEVQGERPPSSQDYVGLGGGVGGGAAPMTG